MKFSDKKKLRNEILNGADSNDSYNKYVELGFNPSKVADVISATPYSDFVNKNKIIIGVYKTFFYFSSLIALLDFYLNKLKFEGNIDFIFSILALALVIGHSYLIWKNYLIGYRLAVVGWFQALLNQLSEAIKGRTIEDYIVVALSMLFLLATFYILKKMYPYNKFLGGSKLEGGNYAFKNYEKSLIDAH